MNRPHQRQRVNVMKAAEMAGISRRTVYNWVSQGRVEYDETPFGVLIYVDSLMAEASKRARTNAREAEMSMPVLVSEEDAVEDAV